MQPRPPRRNSRRPKRPTRCSPTAQKRAAYDQYGHAGVDPNMRGGMGGAEGLWRLCRSLWRHLWRHVRRSARRRGAGGRQVYRGNDLSLRHGNHAGRSSHAARMRRSASRSWDSCDTCHGSGAKPGTSAKTCGTCQGYWHGADAPGLLQRAANLPALPRHGQDHSRALHQLPRPGQDQEAEDAGSEDSRGHRRRHAHPLAPATASQAPTAAHRATCTSKSASRSTTSSSAMAMTCTARCP